MLIQYFFKKENKDKSFAENLYKSILKNSNEIIKDSNFFKEKNFNTSFELISILLIIHININIRYKTKRYKQINEELINTFISDLDESLRQKGIGDMSIGKYVKSYVKKFYYRIKKFPKFSSQVNVNDFSIYLKLFNLINENQHDNASLKFLEIYNNIEEFYKKK